MSKRYFRITIANQEACLRNSTSSRFGAMLDRAAAVTIAAKREQSVSSRIDALLRECGMNVPVRK
jgi:hypothetical protein